MRGWAIVGLLVGLVASASAQTQGRAFTTIATCTLFQGPASFSLPLAGCEDALETNTETPFGQFTSLTNLSCWLSGGTTGAATLTISGRVGPCGSLGNPTAPFVCTMGAGAQRCKTSTVSMGVSTDQCVSFRVAMSSALPGLRSLQCSFERT